MASRRQILANRRNAVSSTGPRTEAGKLKSRRNALRHGLTSEVVIATLEDADEYRTWRVNVTAAFQPTSQAQDVLVQRLASLLWRLRRAGRIEAGLFEMQAQLVRNHRQNQQVDARLEIFRQLLRHPAKTNAEMERAAPLEPTSDEHPCPAEFDTDSGREAASVFLRLSHHHGQAFDRLTRYETMLWRQTAQTLLLIRSL